MVVANQSLVLQRVSRNAAGAYVCVARNVLGEGYSEPLVLDVKCKCNFLCDGRHLEVSWLLPRAS